MTAPRVSIVLPTLNEADNIADLIAQLLRLFRSDGQILVVDDGSRDGTPERVRDCARSHPAADVRLVRRAGPPGLARSLRDGFLAAEADIVAWMDADLSTPPETLALLVRRVEDGCDLAVGSRFLAGGGHRKTGPGSRDPAAPVLLSRALNAVLRRVLDAGLTDFTSGFAAARRRVLRELNVRGEHGEYFIDLAVRARRRGFSVVEEPYAVRPRRRGRSKTASSALVYLRHAWRYGRTAVRLAAG